MKNSHKALYAFFLIAACALYIARIVLTRQRADAALAFAVQEQMIPSAVYFLSVLIMLPGLTLNTSKPGRVTAFLLLIPLILDAWYLLPEGMLPAWELFEMASPSQWILCVKCLMILLVFFAGLRANGARDARRSKEAR